MTATTARAYYNEHDPFAAAWLRELIKAGHIAPGEVDERSIEDVFPNDLRGFTQCHFFAGIGVWSYALRQAGWPDDRPVWTGSCPCQPFSTAGKRKGTADERHLWPALYHLIQQCKPSVFFGEQVSSKDGLAWFDVVQTDLETEGYSVAPIDLCAAGFGAPHIRQRLYFVADSMRDRAYNRPGNGVRPQASIDLINGSVPRESCGAGLNCESGELAHTAQPHGWPTPHSSSSTGAGTQQFGGNGSDQRIAGASGLVNGFWQAADWIPCRDGKYRPVEPGTFPLAHGAPARVGRLRGYGNALVAPVAQGFIEAFLETERDGVIA